MGIWHVFYADWQMECCGKPFRLGEEVSWPLMLHDSGDVLGGGWDDQVSKVVGEVETARGVKVLREETGLVVALPGDGIRLVGLLAVERHGSQWPQVTGRVRGIQVLTQAYAERPPGLGSWEPVPGERSLRPVDTCPKWFKDTGPDSRGRRRMEAGVLVTLEVA